jgi:hypothetical protein
MLLKRMENPTLNSFCLKCKSDNPNIECSMNCTQVCEHIDKLRKTRVLFFHYFLAIKQMDLGTIVNNKVKKHILNLRLTKPRKVVCPFCGKFFIKKGKFQKFCTGVGCRKKVRNIGSYNDICILGN